MRIADLVAAIAGLAVASPVWATAVTIDFESLPAGVPVVGLSITDQFAASYGVTFSTTDSSPLALGMYGASAPVAWTLQPPNGGANLLVAPYDRGSWFVFVDEADTPGRILEIGFTTPVTDASFDLIDVDFGNSAEIDGGRERAVIRAYDNADQLLGSIEIYGGDPATGDGIPTTIPVAFDGQHITRIEIEATAWGGGAVDNLSFAPIPEPTTAALLGLGLLGLARARCTREPRS